MKASPQKLARLLVSNLSLNAFYVSYRKYPELFTWFKEFLGYKDSSPMETPARERTSGELAHLEIGLL